MCSLYEEVVDKVADRLVVTFALGSLVYAPEQGKCLGAIDSAFAKEESQQVTGPNWDHKQGEDSQCVDSEQGRFYWHDEVRGDAEGQNWVDDQESCGSIDATKTDQE